MTRAIMTVTPEFLCEMLGLPKSTSIVGVGVNDSTGEVGLRLEDEKCFPIVEGEETGEVYVHYWGYTIFFPVDPQMPLALDVPREGFFKYVRIFRQYEKVQKNV